MSKKDAPQPITAVIRRRIKAGSEASFEALMQEFIAFVLKQPGHLGINVIRPVSGSRDYTVLDRFATDADRQRFTASSEYMSWMEWLREVSEVEPEIVVVGPDETLIAGHELSVRLKHRQWHSYLRASDFSDGVARYITDQVDEQLLETLFRTERYTRIQQALKAHAEAIRKAAEVLTIQRKVISALITEGLLELQKGLGTRVRKRRVSMTATICPKKLLRRCANFWWVSRGR